MTHTQPDGYLAPPPASDGAEARGAVPGAAPAVLVLHAWWGLNDTIKAFCERLADAGFVVFAPDLYHGRVAATIPEAEALGKQLDGSAQQAIAEIADAADYLHRRAGAPERGLAVVAFSLGAYYAVNLAAARPDLVRSVVLFYGTGDADVSRSRAAFLGHFAENDPYEPREYADALEEALRNAGRPVTFHRYPGVSHWFFEPDRAEAYDAPSAALAWERTLAFLRSDGT